MNNNMQSPEPIIYIKTLIVTILFDKLTIKTLGSLAFITGSFLFSGLSKDAMVALMSLIILDFILGLWEAKTSGRMLTAQKSFKTPLKILIYYTMIASGHLVEYGLPSPLQYVGDTILTFLLITEFLSIQKHLANLGYKTPSKLINTLQKLQEDK